MRVVLVRSGFLGDVVLSTSAVAAVRRKYPDAEIHYATWKQCVEILALNPHLSEIVCPGSYMTSSYDIWLDFRHESLMDEYPRIYWGKLHAMQCADKNLLDWDSIIDFRPELYIGLDDVVERTDIKPIAVVNVFSRNGLNWRLWSFDKWELLVSHLNKMAFKTVQIGASDDPKINGIDIQLCGQTRLAQVVGILAEANLFIGIDSFPAHVAHSLKYTHNVESGEIQRIGESTPSVLIVGPVPKECIIPDNAKCAVASNYLCQGPCNHSFASPSLPICEYNNSCMKELSVEMVLEKIEGVGHCVDFG